MPFPSRRCETCKLRRVKCDETYPTCGQCVKSNRVCKGLKADGGRLVIHQENSYASGREKRPKGPRPFSGQADLGQGQRLSKSLASCDLTTQAMAYYVGHHLWPTEKRTMISLCVTDDFTSIWKSEGDFPMLHLSFSSLALAIFSRTHHHEPAAKKAAFQYHRLLQTAQASMKSLNPEQLNVALLALFFMGRYEDSIHEHNPLRQNISFVKSLTGWPHRNGASAVLKYWKDNRGDRQPTEIIKHIRRGLIRSAIMRNHEVPAWMEDGSEFGEKGLEVQYDRVVVRIVALRYYLSQETSHLPSPPTETNLFQLDKLYEEGQDIDFELQAWTSGLWSYREYPLTDSTYWSKTQFSSRVVYGYSSPSHANLWTQYFAMRMLLNNTLVQILDCGLAESFPSAKDLRLQYLSNMNILANRIASSMPYCLELFDVRPGVEISQPLELDVEKGLKPYRMNLAVWPLTIGSSVTNLDLEQRSWFKSELARIGLALGNGAIICADSDQWLAL